MTSLAEMWAKMDAAWDECGCNNLEYESVKYASFYKHSIWKEYARFSETDPTTLRDRDQMARALVDLGVRCLCDYGGGSGLLGRRLGLIAPDIRVTTFEPYLDSDERKTDHSSIDGFVSHSPHATELDLFDTVTCIDVLEHVPDPVSVMLEIRSLLRSDGYFLVANCFYPVIKCHLPCTFHFRYSFDLVCWAVGFSKVKISGISHGSVYRKVQKPRGWRALLQTIIALSKAFYFFTRLFKYLKVVVGSSCRWQHRLP
ncbi:MAG: class I SAM-dependent methyltransferase [Sphingomonadales bacterium]|nr:class I SAM-dependent methyltransferase [Sphingomonadales bacterium]